MKLSHPAVAQELVERRKNDLAVRQRLIDEGKLFGGYNPEMEKIHLENARRLQELIDQIGWPTHERVGEEGSQAAWLIVQHAISLPSFMKNCLALMTEQEKDGTIDPVNVAFLSDRIALFENRPQSYGTQFTDDGQGQLACYELDAPVDEVNERRRKLGINTIEERLAELTSQVETEQKKRPTAVERQLEKDKYDIWRRRVGWLPA